MAITYSGGQSMPAYGTAAYKAAQSGSGSAPSSSSSSGGGSSVSASAPAGTLYLNGMVATPTANTTSAQMQAALAQGWSTNPNAVSQPIPAANINTVQPFNIPKPPAPVNPGNVVEANNAGLANMLSGAGYVYENGKLVPAPMKGVATGEDDDGSRDRMNNLMTQIGLAPKKESVFKDPMIQAQQAQIQQKQQALNSYTSNLNSIVAKAQADTLSVTGQGRGIPEVIIGGQQAQINKEAAIQALPVQAQIAAAQGDLEIANQHLDTLFKIRSEEINNDFAYKSMVWSSVKDFMTREEEIKLKKIEKKEERMYQETQALNSEAQSYAKMAFQTGQSDLGARISQLDYRAPTFKSDLAKLQSQIKDPMMDLDRKLKEAQLTQTRAQTSKILSEIPSNTSMDPNQAASEVETAVKLIQQGQAKLGDFDKNPLYKAIQSQLASAPKDPAQRVSLENKINQVDSLLNAKGLASAVGPSAIARFDITNPEAFTGARSDFSAGIEQITNDLTLDKLLAVKAQGGTLGALSDKELGLLAAAGSKIGTWRKERGDGSIYYNTTENSMKKELNTIRQLHQEALNRAGGSVQSTPQDVNSFLDIVGTSVIPEPYTIYNVK